MKNTKPSIFMAHAHEDKSFVRAISKLLSDFGVHTWVDEAKINIGDSLFPKIGDGIKQSDYLGAILSKNSVNSNWVKLELELAMTKEIELGKTFVLPIMLEDCKIPQFLSGKVYAKFTSNSDFTEEFNKLLRALGINDRFEITSKILTLFEIERLLEQINYHRFRESTYSSGDPALPIKEKLFRAKEHLHSRGISSVDFNLTELMFLRKMVRDSIKYVKNSNSYPKDKKLAEMLRNETLEPLYELEKTLRGLIENPEDQLMAILEH